MARTALDDLAAFAAVAEQRSFTRAAASLGTSQSALSHTIRRLEARIGLQLLSRTTRNVGLTAAGEELFATLAPALTDIRNRMDALTRLRDRPAGNVRITCSSHAAESVLWPAVNAVMRKFPDVTIELSIDGALTNIVGDQFDAGVRLGEQVQKGMTAICIGPELRLRIVGSPEYFSRYPRPRSPRELTGQKCINLRMATKGDLYAWEFEKDGHSLRVRVDGQFIVNDSAMAVRAALGGHGLACVMNDKVDDLVAEGQLIAVLDDWSPPFPGHHLYFPDLAEPSPALQVLLDELRARAARSG